MEKTFDDMVEDIIKKDARYNEKTYYFVMNALHFTQGKLNCQSHITGRELLEGIRELGIKLYGPMARTVFEHWGIYTTEDFGNIVFNMVEIGLMSKTEHDNIEEFKNVYSFEQAF